MNTDGKSESEQAAIWNGVSGCAWIDLQELLDQVLRPFEDLLVESVVAASASSVLDVGCGTGGTTLAVARSLAATSHCTGIDISQPMIEIGRASCRERV